MESLSWRRADAVAVLFVLFLLAQLLAGGMVHAGDRDQSRASAALALAKAKREREASKTQVVACHTDYAKAANEAATKGKPLMIWVGVKCVERPEFRKEFDDAIHVHMESQNQDATPRVVIQGGDGVEYYVPADKLTKEAAAKVRQKWAAPDNTVPGARARIIEELSYRRPVYVPAPVYRPAVTYPARFAYAPPPSFAGSAPCTTG